MGAMFLAMMVAANTSAAMSEAFFMGEVLQGRGDCQSLRNAFDGPDVRLKVREF